MSVSLYDEATGSLFGSTASSLPSDRLGLSMNRPALDMDLAQLFYFHTCALTPPLPQASPRPAASLPCSPRAAPLVAVAGRAVHGG